jgi:hypothetical protein
VVLELTNFCKAMAEKVKEEKVMLETFMAVKVLAGATLAKWGEEEEGEGGIASTERQISAVKRINHGIYP